MPRRLDSTGLPREYLRATQLELPGRVQLDARESAGNPPISILCCFSHVVFALMLYGEK
jgi:hypothetical protein